MKNKKYLVLLSTLLLVILSSTTVFAADSETIASNAEHFGIWTIIPPLVAIVLAFISKNVVISLFIGALSGCFMLQLSGFGIIGAIVHSFLYFVEVALNSLADPWNAGIVLQVLVIGGIINLVSKMGGAKAIAEALAKKAKTPRSTQIVTWLLGLIVFFDDYANSLIVGPIMKPVDKATAEEAEVKEGIKLSIWNAIIPIGTLIITALIAFYYSGYSTVMNGEDTVAQAIFNSSLFSFEAIRTAFSNADASIALFQSALFSSIVTIALAVFKKIFTISEAIDTWIDGMKGLIITGVILILAWSLGAVIKELGTASYLVTLLSSSIPKFLLPSVIFIFGAVISFSTGTAYGTMGILMPLAIPLAFSISPDMSYVVISTSAVLTGAIFGDHCSPISDTTILSSMGAGCDHIEHVRTQMWYSLFVGVITIVCGYIPAGLGIPVYIVLPVAIAVLTALTYIIGKPVDVE